MALIRQFAIAAALVVCLNSVFAFVPHQQQQHHHHVQSYGTELKAFKIKDEENVRRAMASLMTATFLATQVATSAPAFALVFTNDNNDGYHFAGTTELIAARSGGRAGGRVSTRSMSSPPPISRSSTTYHSTTIVHPPTVISSPAVYMPAPIYDPTPAIGLSLGLSAVNSLGNSMREYRQESEIAQSRAELQMAKQKELELEMRLRQLEMSQAAAAVLK